MRGGLGAIPRKAFRQLGRREFGDLLRGAGRRLSTDHLFQVDLRIEVAHGTIGREGVDLSGARTRFGVADKQIVPQSQFGRAKHILDETIVDLPRCYERDMRSRFARFEESFGEPLGNTITSVGMETWLRQLRLSLVSQNNFCRLQAGLINSGTRRSYCETNPAEEAIPRQGRQGGNSDSHPV